MPITLTTPFAVPNGTRLVITRVNPDEDATTFTITIQLRTPPASNHYLSTKTVVVRNGSSDRISRNVLGADQSVEDFILYEPGALTLANGYTDAINAWRAGATPAARRQALETHLLAVGVIHSTLTGS